MTNKIVLVTGGSRGLGRDMALKLAEKDYDVIITFQSNKEAADAVIKDITAKGRKAAALQLDVAESKSFDAFVNSVKQTLQSVFNAEKIDALVNNAGVGLHANIGDVPEEGLDLMYSVHLKAPYLLTQKLLPIFNNGGSIVNVSSGLTRFSYPGFSAYAIMKSAVDSLTSYQALEFGNRQIRVNTLAPGAIETDFGGGMVKNNAELNKMIADRTALGRVGQPDDIGGVVAFLCSTDAKWVNGQRIEVSGGIHL
jgi:NAD(P)-dependent dehydrogenase (short-subunit alcohol dehydrogenase family)